MAAKIVVTGSRTLDIKYWRNPTTEQRNTCYEARKAFTAALEDAIAELIVTSSGLRQLTIVHGASTHGADAWADQFVYDAWASGKFDKSVLHVERWEAEWKKYGKRAGYIRNAEMVASLDPDDEVIAISAWDGISSGTSNTINLLEQANRQVRASWH